MVTEVREENVTTVLNNVNQLNSDNTRQRETLVDSSYNIQTPTTKY